MGWKRKRLNGLESEDYIGGRREDQIAADLFSKKQPELVCIWPQSSWFSWLHYFRYRQYEYSNNLWNAPDDKRLDIPWDSELTWNVFPMVAEQLMLHTFYLMKTTNLIYDRNPLSQPLRTFIVYSSSRSNVLSSYYCAINPWLWLVVIYF